MAELATPSPRFATARDPDAPTLGARQGAFAASMLGQPFMPHQQLIADVTGELRQTDDPRGWTVPGHDGFWVPRYKVCLITEQRQAGKSHQAMAGNGERCFAVPGFRSWYTAQTGQDARDQFLKFEEENIRGRPLSPFVRLKRGRGEEVLVFPNGATMRPHPPTEEKLHGKQSHRNDVDEGWAFSEDEGKALMQAIAPTQLTIPTAQTFIWSAGGTAESTWLAGLVARVREGDSDIAGFEYGIPDDADAEDLDVILRHHPAAGRTISRESLAALRVAFKDDPAGWARAAGNRWTEVIGGAIAAEDWKRLRYADPIPDDAPVGYGAARSADGSQVVIVAAAEVDGLVVCEVIAVLPGSFGFTDRIKHLTDGPLGIAVNGPSRNLWSAAGKVRRVKVVKFTDPDYSAACADLVDAIEPRTFRFRKNPVLDDAVKVAVKRTIGDGGFVWSRREATAPIAALEAATVAANVLLNRPASRGKPRIIRPSRAA